MSRYRKKIKNLSCIIILAINLLVAEAFASLNIRDCMLLPVTDSVGGAISFKVFQEIESYLKSSEWCVYKSNSEIINILESYNDNLAEHLKNKEVLRLLSTRSKAGSLIRVDIVSEMNGVTLKVDVLGENGDDVYFSEKTKLDSDDIVIISQAVKNWLEVYKKTIPYDGRIIGILGEQLTMDFGKDSGALVDDEVFIVRPLRKKKHPLLKEIVEWETKDIAQGIIVSTSRRQSMGKIKKYDSRRGVRLGDWVRIRKRNDYFASKDGGRFFKDNEKGLKRSFGKLGRAGLFLNFSSGEVAITSNASSKSMGGTLVGVTLLGELWATRNYFVSYEGDQRYGTFKEKTGSFSNSSNSVSMGGHKFKVGYRYLPLGFFYGPQVDGFLGYAVYKYGLQTQANDGLVESSLKAIILGTKGDMPIRKLFRIFLEFDFFVKTFYSEEVTVYGEKDSASGYYLAAGGNYAYDSNMVIEAKFGLSSQEIDFESPEQEVEFNDSAFIKAGLIITF